MCIVSNISDWGMRRWSFPDEYQKSPKPFTIPQAPIVGPTKEQWEEFKDMIKKAMELDQKTGQPDCVDPKKEEWMKKMSKIYDETYGS